MNAIRTIAGLTVRGAARRKLHVVSLLVAVGFLALSPLPHQADRTLGDVGPLGSAMRIGRPPVPLVAPTDLIYVGAYVDCALAAAGIIFRRRDA